MAHTDKRIEDYLHLYLGCEIVYQGGIGFHILDEYRLSKIFAAKNFERWKPILRPLSDMSEKELKDLRNIPNGIKFIEGFIDLAVTPERVKYLLSKHFDLFGLIEAGLAFDKTSKVNRELK